MDELLSPRWHQVASHRPRLLSTAELTRRRVRGQTWMVLRHPDSGRSLRLLPSAWAWVARMDGQRSLQQLWELTLAGGDDPPTQDECIGLLLQLHEAGLLSRDANADFHAWAQARRLTLSEQRSAARSLLAWRLPLFDPSPWLERLTPRLAALFTPAALALWTLALAALGLLAAQHGASLWAHGQTWLATPRYLLLAALLYAPLKLVHELAHGVAVHHAGGRVPQAGVTLMFGLPVPWVDASAASALPLRRQRALVAGAGMMAELAMAALALGLWLWLDDGLARDAAFVVLVITGVSTLVFNANPLQRLDGYHLLTDLLELPNLATRSRRWWLEQLQRHGLGVPPAQPLVLAAGERPWLVAYAPLSWLVVLAIAAAAARWLGGISATLGLLAAAVLAWQVGLKPAWRLRRELRRVALTQPMARAGARRWRRFGLAVAAAGLLLLALPWPQQPLLQGVVWPAEQAQLRAGEAGFVKALHARDGQTVAAGALVVELGNPALEAEHRRQAARVAALETQLLAALPAPSHGDSPTAGDLRERLGQAQAALARLDERLQALRLHAAQAGQVSLPGAEDLDGAWITQGRLLGQVLGHDGPTVRAALPQAVAPPAFERSMTVSVVLASAPSQVHSARLVHELSGPTQRLPSAALSQRHGGGIRTDPKDDSATQALQPVLLLDLQLEPNAPVRLGERAWVRLGRDPAPLGWVALQRLRQTVLDGFHPAR